MSTYRSKVTERGQVTIPQRLRERIGIKPGGLIEFEEGETGEFVARKVAVQSGVDRVYGILDLDRSTDEFVAELRDEVDPR